MSFQSSWSWNRPPGARCSRVVSREMLRLDRQVLGQRFHDPHNSLCVVGRSQRRSGSKQIQESSRPVLRAPDASVAFITGMTAAAGPADFLDQLFAAPVSDCRIHVRGDRALGPMYLVVLRRSAGTAEGPMIPASSTAEARSTRRQLVALMRARRLWLNRTASRTLYSYVFIWAQNLPPYHQWK